jgi:hypothetical protein
MRTRQSHGTSTCHLYAVAVRITCLDRAIIRQHFAEHRSARAEGQVREPGSVHRHEAALSSRLRTKLLPCALELKLSALAAGYQRVLVDGDVLLIETATRRFVDAMRNTGVAHSGELS